MTQSAAPTVQFADALAYLDEHASYDKTGRVTSPTTEPIAQLDPSTV